MDAMGHVAVYIPDPLKLSSPQGSFSVAGSVRGEDVSAELLGVDQRLSVAFLKVSAPPGEQAVFGRGIEEGFFQVMSWDGSGWVQSRYKVIESSRNVFGPVQTIRAAETDRESSGRGHFRNNPERRASFVLDDQGRLVGLGVSSSPTGLSRRAMEFKVFPIETVRESLHQLRKMKGGFLESGWIGVYIDAAESGVRVTRVVDGSPALEVGLRAGDTIVAFDGKPLARVEDFIQAVKWSGPLRDVRLTVVRTGIEKEYEMALGRSPVYQKPAYEWALDIPPVMSSPEQLSQNVRFRPVPSYQRRNIGIQVGPLTAQLAEFFKSPTGKGLLVEAVEPGSLASHLGLKAGDVLIMIDKQILKSSSDLARMMDASLEPVVLSYVRDGKVVEKRVLFR